MVKTALAICCVVYTAHVGLALSPFAGAYGGEGVGSGTRIISLYAAHTEILLRLGARDNIIGVSMQETYDGPETQGWNPDTYSFRDDVEKFLAARPDIVLARPQHVAGGRHMRDALEKAGIRVLPIQVVKASDLYGYWRELAALVGKEKEAEAMIAEFEAHIIRYREISARMKNRPGVFIESIHREVKTFTPDSIPVWLVDLAGGRNVASDASPASPGVIVADYGPEKLLAKASEVDIFLSQEGAMNRTPLETIKQREIYQALPAVRNSRVYKISESTLARPTPSLLVGLEAIAGWTGLLDSMVENPSSCSGVGASTSR